jgi:hypothetical protein
MSDCFGRGCGSDEGCSRASLARSFGQNDLVPRSSRLKAAQGSYTAARPGVPIGVGALTRTARKSTGSGRDIMAPQCLEGVSAHASALRSAECRAHHLHDLLIRSADQPVAIREVPAKTPEMRVESALT